MEKRYLLFAGDNYYPVGGIKDYRGTFDKEVDALVQGARYDWAQLCQVNPDGTLTLLAEWEDWWGQDEAHWEYLPDVQAKDDDDDPPF